MEFRTERLRLRPLRPSDAADLHPYLSDRDNVRWWHRPVSDTMDDTRQAVAADAAGGASWAICLRGADRALGFVSYPVPPEQGAIAGFGYFLGREHWGNGYVVEAARPVLDHGFDVVGMAGVELWIYEGNEQSIRVAEKLGGVLRGMPHLVNVVRGFVPRGRVYRIERTAPSTGIEQVRSTPRFTVPDIAATIDWYQDRLGWRADFVVGDPPFTAGLVGPGVLPAVALVRLTVGEPRPAEVFVLVPEGLDALASRAGDAVVEPPEDKPWGLREFAIRDPWGNVLRFEGPTAAGPS